MVTRAIAAASRQHGGAPPPGLQPCKGPGMSALPSSGEFT